MKLYIAILTIVIAAIGCRKDTNQPIIVEELSLIEKLEGRYTGYVYYEHEDIDCPSCAPPCNFDYTYDTIYIEVRIEKISEDSIQLTDLTQNIATRQIPIDSSLTYYGWPQGGAPYGHYNLEFRGLYNDSLILDLVAGGGSNCYGNYYYRDYILTKEQ